jgi:hypothetical protein
VLRLRDAVALRVVDAETGEHLDDLRVLSELAYRLLAGQVPDLVDRRDYEVGVRFRYADRANRTLVTLEASQKRRRRRPLSRGATP